jgi:tRNA modification GTPase
MIDFNPDTIAAIATPLGEGGIGIIRLSGSGSKKIIARIFEHKNKAQLKPNFFYHGQIVNIKSKEKIDDVCVVFFKSPRSYTGEDVVEIHAHSNVYILKKILELVLLEGARIAEKGEFTKRAFLNGKLDLTQAEAVLDLIHAKCAKAHKVALGHLQGGLYNHLESIENTLMTILEQIEGSIDFPDDVEEIDNQSTRQKLNKIYSKVNNIIKIQDYGQLVLSGIRCLIIGKPNVGKSSLLNALIGKERAIVTSIPGTTRDFIDAQLELGGLIFEFIDTAGFRHTKDPVEQKGVKNIYSLLKKAQIVFWVVDNSTNFDELDEYVFNNIKTRSNVYIIANKIDKKQKLNVTKLADKSGFEIINISAKCDIGIDDLKNKIHNDFVKRNENTDLDLICNARQLQCIKQLNKILKKLLAALDKNVEDVLIAHEIRETLKIIKEISGKEITEELLEGIFSKFCIGK